MLRLLGSATESARVRFTPGLAFGVVVTLVVEMVRGALVEEVVVGVINGTLESLEVHLTRVNLSCELLVEEIE